MNSALTWIDGHLDLAYLAETGRDMTLPAEVLPVAGAVTLPALREGRVRKAFGTIFIQKRKVGQGAGKDVDGPWCFGTEEEAHVAALRQVSRYLEWRKEGDVKVVGLPEVVPPKGVTREPLEVVVLMEGAAGVRSVGDLQTFYQCGVRMISLTWSEGTKWAGGNGTGGGITAEGLELVAEIDRLGMIHDVSHLAEEAFWTLMEKGKGLKVASHSNCRALLPKSSIPQRHLSDEQIRALVKEGGVIGVALYTGFLKSELEGAGAEDVVRHVRHIIELTGREDCVALGSDMDGGFGPKYLPRDIQHPRELGRLAEALSAAGFSDGMIEGFARGNWERVVGGIKN